MHLRMNRTVDGVGTRTAENDIPGLAGWDVAGIGCKFWRIDEGVVKDVLIVDEVNGAAFRNNQACRCEYSTGLTHLELGGGRCSGRKTQHDGNK